MGNGTASKEEFKAKRIGKFRWTKWNAPLLLLLLAFTFMIVAILSDRPQSAPDQGSLAPYALIALLCTLVAVAAMLIGRASRQTDRSIRSATSEAGRSSKNLLRLCRVGLRANRRTTTKISRLEEGQRQLLDKLAKLTKVIESRRDTPEKVAPGCEQELTESIAAVASSNQAVQTRIDGLLLAGKLMSGKISAAADNQESLHKTVQEHGELLDGRVSDLADEMQQVRDHIDGLKELIQTVAGDVTDLALEQTRTTAQNPCAALRRCRRTTRPPGVTWTSSVRLSSRPAPKRSRK